MRTATIRIEGLTPYSQSRAFQSEKRKEETHQDFDERAWPEHQHVDGDGHPVIPATAILQGMAAAASYLSKGGDLKKKGAATWAENFRCGLALAANVPFEGSGVHSERVYCHADGKRGSGKRVWRTFPQYDQWSATITMSCVAPYISRSSPTTGTRLDAE